jgi:hypothetical protein
MSPIRLVGASLIGLSVFLGSALLIAPVAQLSIDELGGRRGGAVDCYVDGTSNCAGAANACQGCNQMTGACNNPPGGPQYTRQSYANVSKTLGAGTKPPNQDLAAFDCTQNVQCFVNCVLQNGNLVCVVSNFVGASYNNVVPTVIVLFCLSRNWKAPANGLA